MDSLEVVEEVRLKMGSPILGEIEDEDIVETTTNSGRTSFGRFGCHST